MSRGRPLPNLIPACLEPFLPQISPAYFCLSFISSPTSLLFPLSFCDSILAFLSASSPTVPFLLRLSLHTPLISFILYSLFYFISFLLSSYLHVSSKIFASSLFIFNAASKHAPTFKPWGLSVPAYRTSLSSDCYIFYAGNALFQLWN